MPLRNAQLLALSLVCLLSAAPAFAEDPQTFWNNPAFATPYRPSLSEDERVTGLSRLWAEVKFNFANFDLVPDQSVSSGRLVTADCNSPKTCFVPLWAVSCTLPSGYE